MLNKQQQKWKEIFYLFIKLIESVVAVGNKDLYLFKNILMKLGKLYLFVNVFFVDISDCKYPLYYRFYYYYHYYS